MEKLIYESPQIEVVEIQLSECIAGSTQAQPGVNVEEGKKREDIVVTPPIVEGNPWDDGF